ncbi:MAG: FAD-binding oxidoreductase [Burkholderiales bacterium]|nr:FAD-binding oxidoreductase [Burkholderiales bacterium]
MGAAAREVDTLVVGGGVVGMSVAYGLARAGERVRVLDEGDDAFRATRGNFGLVWVQGKGLGRPAYARWTLASAARWPGFAAELAAGTGIDVDLKQPGGLSMCLSEQELAARGAQLAALRDELGEPYPFEVLDAAAVRALVPGTGPDIVGAVYCPLDGHTSPLKLLRALVQAFAQRGGELAPGVPVQDIRHRHGAFEVRAGGGVHAARRLVLAAGLGNRALAPLVGLRAPVLPNRGQILVTERLRPFLAHPTLHVRQTAEGVVQIGDSKEDVGLDDGTTLAELARIAARAARCFPLLEGVNIVRTWGALRVMSPDGFPIYEASASCPGAFVLTCHSGITLAAQHAGPLVDWIRGGAEPAEITGFKAARFEGQSHAATH